MVLKGSKGGVCSGNTLRLTKSRFQHHYAATSGITCNVSNNPDTGVNMGETQFLDNTGIFYSLNKKGRWLLPDLIKDEIETSVGQSSCKVSLIELQNIVRKNNCIGYFTNKGHTKCVLPKNTVGFLNRDSVVNVNNKPYKRHNRKVARRGTGELIEPASAEPSVDYRVIYPGSVESSVTLANPKAVAEHIHLKRVSGDRSSDYKNSYKSRKHKEIRDLINEENEMDVDFLKTVCEANNNPSEEGHNSETGSKLGEFFQHALTKKTTHTNKKQSRKRNHSQNGDHRQTPQYRSELINRLHAEYLNNSELAANDANGEQPDVTEAAARFTKPIPVNVILPKQDVDTSFLVNDLPFPVSFAECQPRTFIITTTAILEERLRNSELFRKITIQKLDLTSYLVFSFQGTHDAHHDTYSVHLNMATEMATIRIETIFEMMDSTLEELLNRCFVFFETLDPETFIQKEQIYMASKPSISHETIGPFVQLQQGSILPNNLAEASTSTLVDDFEWITSDEEERSCNICFESVASRPCTALRACGHWFCNECWREYLINNITFAKQDDIVCAEFDCDNEVDTWSMVSLLNVRDIKRCQTRKINHTIDTSPFFKWCPNKQCGRILQNVDGSDSLRSIVQCKCGIEVCFSCTRESHWPASCAQYKAYSNKMNAFNDDILNNEFNKYLPVQVRGKSCPKCHQFIEKNGGCRCMNCVCGANFCWHCLKLYSVHAPSGCNNISFTQDTVLKYIRHIERKVEGEKIPAITKFYLLALENRKQRLPRHIKFFIASAMKLKSRVKTWLRKQDESELGFHGSVDSLIESVINLKFELNYIAEFCFVKIDSDRRKPSNVRFAAFRLQNLSEHLCDLCLEQNCLNIKETLSRILSLKETAQVEILSVVTKFTR